RNTNLCERPQTRGKLAGITLRRAAHHFDKVTKITEQPATHDTDSIVESRLNVAALSHLGEPRREVYAGIDRQRQRIPEAPVDLHKNRRAITLLAKLDHRYAVPPQGAKDGERRFFDPRVGAHALAQCAARSRRSHVA